MTSKEFKKLKKKLEKTMIKLQKLQFQYMKQTGRRFVLPVRW